MVKIDVSSESARHLLHPKMVVLASSLDQEGNPNIITLAWAMPTSFDPPLVAISVGRTRYSHDLIQEAGEFVINVPSEDLLNEVKFCGSHSGSTTDKFRKAGITAVDSEEVEAPRIKECVAHLECDLFDEFPAGDHTIFVGKILAGSVEDDIFDEDSGNYDMGKFEPIFHVGGSQFIGSGKEL